jgi:cell division protein FtsL
MIISALIATNILTGIALVSYICESIHNREMTDIAKQNIRQATDTLDREWRRLQKELATHRKLNREIASMGGNRIKDYL